MPDINYYAVLVAAVISFAIGGLWYSPLLFGKQWLAEMELSEQDARQGPAVFVISFIFSLVAVFILADLLGPAPQFAHAVTVGALIGALIFLAMGVTYQFSQKSLRHLLIDGGYHIAQFTVFGLILGSWH